MADGGRWSCGSKEGSAGPRVSASSQILVRVSPTVPGKVLLIVPGRFDCISLHNAYLLVPPRLKLQRAQIRKSAQAVLGSALRCCKRRVRSPQFTLDILISAGRASHHQHIQFSGPYIHFGSKDPPPPPFLSLFFEISLVRI